MKRVIVDYKKLSEEILNLLVTKYPNGFDDADTITFRNAQNELVECIEARTEDTIYLVKVSKRLVEAMDDHELDDDDEPMDDVDMDFDEEEIED